MIVSLLAAAALAASPLLTVRLECDAAFGQPTTVRPDMRVRYQDNTSTSSLPLNTLVSTTATTSFAVLLTGRVAELRTFVVVAYDVAGNALGKAVVDVDTVTGEVFGAEGSGVTIARYTGRGDDAATIRVELQDAVALGAVVVTLADITGDGAIVEGDAFEQAIALMGLSSKGRDLVGSYTFDDAHGIDSSRQVWEGALAVDTAWADKELTFSSDADRCLPEGVEAPADGTLTWTETLALKGSTRNPKWKSVTLGLKEADTETWVWPFTARVEDETPPFVVVSLDTFEGAIAPRASEVAVYVPARERLSGDGRFMSALRGKTQTLKVDVHPFGDASRPLTTFVVTRDGSTASVVTTSYLTVGAERGGYYDETKDTWELEDEALESPASGGTATWDGETYAFSRVTLTGPEQADWDGAIDIAVGGAAVWADLEVTATLTTDGATETITYPLATLVSVFQGEFVFDADPSGGMYGWGCVGCGDDFEPFEVEARFGIGTRPTASQASNKAELL
ncbi:MAG: hypothetical protein Q8P18_09855 [Pseudomonadota bacterium]|nr:hypothetical protein [Pseudomonadota bacterium]